ncbi:MAG: hypothetical protein HKL83_00550 [Acidimicrobiaceae bacterium]|nr:hypothetical protein [Acidimicrobiaceae bacterium]
MRLSKKLSRYGLTPAELELLVTDFFKLKILGGCQAPRSVTALLVAPTLFATLLRHG